MSALAAASPRTILVRLRDRIEDKGARHGLVYPWWIPVLSTVGLVGGAVVGAAQRLPDGHPVLLVVAPVITLAPCVLHFGIRPWLPWWVEAPFVLLGVGLLLTVPVSDSEATDLAPLSLAFSVGEITATDGGRRGLLVAGAGVVLLVGVGDYPPDVLGLFVGEILVGLVVGYMLRWQMRALAAEQAARDEERERATLAERQRVAREIHDLVAHSLAVTMLHVTGARRALEQDGDIPDAVDALTDAERIGRQAMADVRRTVGLLRTDDVAGGGVGAAGDDTRALPGAGDLDDLVAGFTAAGLDVTWTCTGDLRRLDGSTGLGVYRVVQESLANVARHAPGARVEARLEVRSREARLVVRNPVLAGAVVGTDGSGVAGMTSRVDQLGGRLRVGRDGDEWRVDLTVPLGPECRR